MIKKFLMLSVAIVLLAGCSAVRVNQDYAIGTDFNKYKTYAYFKQGIDEADVSELDKKRILRALDTEMQAKGFIKSTDPDVIISFFTDAQERVDVFNNVGWGWGGWGWGGFGGWGWGNNVSRTTEGVLFIDFIDAKSKDLIWQGIGRAALKSNPKEKVERTNLMVKQILEQFPPQPEK
ncbi:MAG: DUF4136 domain-containing protein [Nonlabens sp.]